MESGLENLVRALASTPSADNAQPWRFVLCEGRCSVRFHRTAGEELFTASSHATQLSAGAMQEVLTQYAAHCRFNAVIRPSAAGDELFSFDLPPGGQCLSPDGLPFMARHTNRSPYRTERLPESVLEDLEALQSSDARFQMLTGRPEIDHVAELVRVLSAIRFRSEVLHRGLMDSLRFPPQSSDPLDGLDVASLPLPPGGGRMLQLLRPWPVMRALNRIGAYSAFAAMEGSSVKASAGLLGIVGDGSAQGVTSAGRALMRAWTVLNARGLAAHPYYVLVDLKQRVGRGVFPVGGDSVVSDSSTAASAAFGAVGGKMLQMVLRVGTPTRSFPVARRLPPDQLVVIDQ